jgi:membrane peptidoglycan carboxypeptidase
VCGSTLTAQLAKNAYLHGYDHTLQLKLEDLLLAVKIEKHYPKSSTLEMYLNLVYFGEGAYGIDAAAWHYFSVAPAQLDLAESALLAGLVRAPGAYDPWCHPALAKARQLSVFARMLEEAYVTSVQVRAASAEPFPFWQSGTSRSHTDACSS